MTAHLEHANFTVSDVQKTARWMSDLFGWHIRWEGPSSDGGHSLHIGTQAHYLALYQPNVEIGDKPQSYTARGTLNHIGVVVDDIEATEEQVKALGFVPKSHADYEPGRRFYFFDQDGIEYEVVQYD